MKWQIWRKLCYTPPQHCVQVQTGSNTHPAIILPNPNLDRVAWHLPAACLPASHSFTLARSFALVSECLIGDCLLLTHHTTCMSWCVSFINKVVWSVTCLWSFIYLRKSQSIYNHNIYLFCSHTEVIFNKPLKNYEITSRYKYPTLQNKLCA